MFEFLSLVDHRITINNDELSSDISNHISMGNSFSSKHIDINMNYVIKVPVKMTLNHFFVWLFQMQLAYKSYLWKLMKESICVKI